MLQNVIFTMGKNVSSHQTEFLCQRDSPVTTSVRQSLGGCSAQEEIEIIYNSC